ncbi:MAG: hypothetical protein WCZ27_04975 [Tissierellaceae bacterium]
MKKRLISPRHLKNVYKRDLLKQDMDFEKDVDRKESYKLPREMFEILGQLISYIENINKLEGDKK